MTTPLDTPAALVAAVEAANAGRGPMPEWRSRRYPHVWRPTTLWRADQFAASLTRSEYRLPDPEVPR